MYLKLSTINQANNFMNFVKRCSRPRPGRLQLQGARRSETGLFLFFTDRFLPLLPLAISWLAAAQAHQNVMASKQNKLDDGWSESEKDVFQAALSMVVVKDSR